MRTTNGSYCCNQLTNRATVIELMAVLCLSLCNGTMPVYWRVDHRPCEKGIVVIALHSILVSIYGLGDWAWKVYYTHRDIHTRALSHTHIHMHTHTNACNFLSVIRHQIFPTKIRIMEPVFEVRIIEHVA